MRKPMAPSISIEDLSALLANLRAECLRLADECRKLSERLSQPQDKKKSKRVTL
jgi:uncharacterized coiled-coil protein SlyX